MPLVAPILAKDFYLHMSSTIADYGDYGVYTSFGYLTFPWPISKSFLAIKDITKPLRQIGVKLWKIGSIQNQYSIVVYVLMSDRESKNPRPMWLEYSSNWPIWMQKVPNEAFFKRLPRFITFCLTKTAGRQIFIHYIIHMYIWTME